MSLLADPPRPDLEEDLAPPPPPTPAPEATDHAAPPAVSRRRIGVLVAAWIAITLLGIGLVLTDLGPLMEARDQRSLLADHRTEIRQKSEEAYGLPGIEVETSAPTPGEPGGDPRHPRCLGAPGGGRGGRAPSDPARSRSRGRHRGAGPARQQRDRRTGPPVRSPLRRDRRSGRGRRDRGDHHPGPVAVRRRPRRDASHRVGGRRGQHDRGRGRHQPGRRRVLRRRPHGGGRVGRARRRRARRRRDRAPPRRGGDHRRSSTGPRRTIG